MWRMQSTGAIGRIKQLGGEMNDEIRLQGRMLGELGSKLAKRGSGSG